MAAAVGSVISGVLGSTGNSGAKNMAQTPDNGMNKQVSDTTKQPEINKADVKEAAKPVETSQKGGSSNWQDLARMATNLAASQSGSAPLVGNNANPGLSQSVAR